MQDLLAAKISVQAQKIAEQVQTFIPKLCLVGSRMSINHG